MCVQLLRCVHVWKRSGQTKPVVEINSKIFTETFLLGFTFNSRIPAFHIKLEECWNWHCWNSSTWKNFLNHQLRCFVFVYVCIQSMLWKQVCQVDCDIVNVRWLCCTFLPLLPSSLLLYGARHCSANTMCNNCVLLCLILRAVFLLANPNWLATITKTPQPTDSHFWNSLHSSVCFCWPLLLAVTSRHPVMSPHFIVEPTDGHFFFFIHVQSNFIQVGVSFTSHLMEYALIETLPVVNIHFVYGVFEFQWRLVSRPQSFISLQGFWIAFWKVKGCPNA